MINLEDYLLRLMDVKKRDEFVIKYCHKNQIPLQISMGGGYSSELKEIIDAHSNTFRIAQETFF